VIPHFAKKTEMSNYTKMAYKKVIQIHRKLPDGGILVFLTGKREILQMTNKLRRYFNRRSISTVVTTTDQAEPAATAASSTISPKGVGGDTGLPGIWAQGDEAMEEEEEDEGGEGRREDNRANGRRKSHSSFAGRSEKVKRSRLIYTFDILKFNTYLCYSCVAMVGPTARAHLTVPAVLENPTILPVMTAITATTREH
jgi:hypothetical protein